MQPTCVGPAVAQFLDPSNIVALSKKPEALKSLEAKLKDLKHKHILRLESQLGPQHARIEVAPLINLVIRCQLCKAWPQDLDPKITLPVGNYSEAKILDLER